MKTLKFGLGMAILALAGAAGATEWWGDTTFTTNQTFDAVYTNSTALTVAGGTAASPIVFSATDSANGLTQTESAYYNLTLNPGAYLKIVSGTYNFANDLKPNGACFWLTGGRVTTKFWMPVSGNSTIVVDGGELVSGFRDGAETDDGRMNLGTEVGATVTLTQNGGRIRCSNRTNGKKIDAEALTLGEQSGTTVNVNLNGGECVVDGRTHIGYGANSTATLAVNGGTLTAKNDIKLGWAPGATSELSIGSGGNVTVNSGSSTWIFMAIETGSSSKITLNEGGTLTAWHIQNIKDATVEGTSSELAFNGGTLKCQDSSSTQGTWASYYLLGNSITDSDTLNVTVSDKGGTIDNNGKTARINRPISGTGTLNFTGLGNTILYKTPTCPVRIANGIVTVTNGFEFGSSLTLGAGGFLEYDLSSVTESGLTTNLAENITISVAEGDSVARHIIIKNGSTDRTQSPYTSISWNVSYDATTKTLSATSTSDDVAQGAFTIFTGYYDGNYPNNQGKSFVNGRATDTTTEVDVIVPASTKTLGLYANMSCSNFVMNGDLEIVGKNQWVHFHPRHVSGTGTLTFTAGDKYGYLEGSNPPSGSSYVDIDVPVILGGSARISSWPTKLLRFNKPVTITGSGVAENEDATSTSVFMDDLTITGKYTASKGVALAKGKTFSGSGSLEGALDLSAGAIVGATITNANGTAEYVTVTGTANLKNATISVAGGDLIESVTRDTAITLFKATTISNWTDQTVTFGGKTWNVKAVTSDTADDTLVATPAVGFTIIFR